MSAAEAVPSGVPLPPLLEIAGLSKSFPGVLALDGVSFRLDRGEVVALVGENGAGKSTVINILAGIHRADAGRVLIDGEEVVFTSPAQSIQRAVAIIHQELSLAENLSIAANLFLGREPLRTPALGFIDRRRMLEETREALTNVGMSQSPAELVSTLSAAQRQLVEIARALAMDACLVVMDEPTSSLGEAESEKVLAAVEELRAKGTGVLYVSHRLREVARIAERAIVLRDGRMVAELEGGKMSEARLVSMMVGDKVTDAVPRPRGAAGPVVLRVCRLQVATGGPLVEFELCEGEILGVFGLVGAGRSQLLETIFGLRKPASGVISIAGQELPPGRVESAVRAGLGLVPEDRKEQGLVLEMSLQENLLLAGLVKGGLWGIRRPAAELRKAQALVERFGIRAESPDAEVRNLSGGNQQKVVLAKWLSLEPRVLLLDEPTRGVDIAAKAEIHRLIRELSDQGVGIVFSSSELEEVLSHCERILVMREGAIAGALGWGELSRKAVMRLATGVVPGEAEVMKA